MTERSNSPKLERPEIILTDVEEEGQDQHLPPPGISNRSQSKRKAAVAKPVVEVELSTLLKFIKPYDGRREQLNSFLVNCTNAYELASESQKDILFKYILCQLQGKAEIACSIKEFTNWQQLKEFLKTQFSERKHYAHLLTELQDCKQRPTEPVSQFALRIETCLSQLLTEISISHSQKSKETIGRTAAMEELALHHFQMGLLPRLSNFVRCKSAKSLNDAINIAISEERIQQALFKPNLSQFSHQPSRQDRVNTPRVNTQFNRRNQGFFNESNQRPNFGPNRFYNNNPNNNPSTPFCRYCKNPGHTLEQCRKREFNNNRLKNFDRNQPGTSQRVHFVSDELSEPINYEYPADPVDGYDTVDSNPKNE